MSTKKIITANVYPPIPVRCFDWCAYLDGEEERGQYGWGETEAEAIADLHQRFDDEYDEPTNYVNDCAARGIIPPGVDTDR